MFGSTTRPGMRGTNSLTLGAWSPWSRPQPRALPPGLVRQLVRSGRYKAVAQRSGGGCPSPSCGWDGSRCICPDEIVSRTRQFLGSLSGTVFSEAAQLGDDTASEQIVSYKVIDTTTGKTGQVGAQPVSGSVTATIASIGEELKKAGVVAPRYQVTYSWSGSDGTTSTASTMQSTMSKLSALPTKTKVALGAGVLAAAYLLFK